MENLILNADKPDCISFISLRFSRTDVATWMSNARARSPLLDLHFEGYVQSISAIAQPRLNRWIPEAIWNGVGGKLSQSNEYNLFSRANEVYEYLNSGSLAANKDDPRREDNPLPSPLCAQTYVFSILVFRFFHPLHPEPPISTR